MNELHVMGVIVLFIAVWFIINHAQNFFFRHFKDCYYHPKSNERFIIMSNDDGTYTVDFMINDKVYISVTDTSLSEAYLQATKDL